MHKRMTIRIDAAVYDGLVRMIGRRKISRLLDELARPRVLGETLEDAYAAMAADEAREADARSWSEGLVGDGADALLF